MNSTISTGHSSENLRDSKSKDSISHAANNILTSELKEKLKLSISAASTNTTTPIIPTSTSLTSNKHSIPNIRVNEVETESDTSSLSEESSSGGPLAFPSFISNINYIADHIDAINDVENSKGGRQLRKFPSREPHIDEYLQYSTMQHHLRLGSAQELQQRNQANFDERPGNSFLNGYVLETQIKKLSSTDIFYRGYDSRTTEKKKIALRISTPYSTISKIFGIFNEWFVLSGTNPNKRHPLWTNETINNDYFEKSEINSFNQNRVDILTPATLPLGIEGVLYPIDAFCIPYYRDGIYNPLNNRMVLVFEDRQYSTMTAYHQNLYVDLYQDLEDYKVPYFQVNSGRILSTRSKTESLNNGNTTPVKNVSLDGTPDPNAAFHSQQLAHSKQDNDMSSIVTSNDLYSSPFNSTSNISNQAPGFIAPATVTPYDIKPIPNSAIPGTGNGLFDELQFKVRQHPKQIILIIEILSDIIKIFKTLKVVHELRIVHNGLTSGQVLKSSSATESDSPQLTGWDFYCSIQPEDCSYGYRKSHLLQVPELLPYLSPESTGEANMSVDYRSDYYSVGIIMYELIVGCLPFQSDKPTNLLRMQILQKPIAPFLLASGWVTEQLSDIILKLLEKQPEDRYSDSASIINDLVQVKNSYIDHVANCSREVYEFWSSHNHMSKYMKREELSTIDGLEIDSRGTPPLFLIPRKVIGRKKEYSNINRIYESFSKGINMILISGPEGVGKSTMINDLRLSPLSKSELYFSWKFNTFDPNTSVYQCLIHGIRTIFKQILSTSPAAVSKWRDIIISKVNLDLSVLFLKVPELKQILGAKYSNIYENRSGNATGANSNTEGGDYFSHSYSNSTEVSSAEYRVGTNERTLNLEIKFRHTIKVLYSLFGLEGITVFLEDMQWCTGKEWAMISESLEFFQENDIQNEVSVKIVATFGTTRGDSNFVPDIEKEQLLEYLSSANITIHCIDVQNLEKEFYKEFIKAVLKVDTARVNLRVSTDFASPIDSGIPYSPTKVGNRNSSGSFSTNSSKLSLGTAGLNTSFRKLNISSNEPKDLKVESLTDLLFEKTKGSILFTSLFLKTAYLKGLINFQKCDEMKGKRWDITYDSDFFQVEKDDIIKTFLDVALSEEAKSLMKFAAISSRGYHFYLSELMVVSNLPLQKVIQLLNLCLECKIIIPGNTYYKFPFHLINGRDQFGSNQANDEPVEETFFGLSDSKIWQIANHTRYKFSHDAIVHALQKEMKSKGEFEQYHKHCGIRGYKKDIKDNQLNISQYLAMANHFVISSKLAVTPEEKDIYFDVLVQAGKYASSTQKMDSSLIMFECADLFIDLKDIKKKLKNLLTICQIQFYLKNYEKCLELIDRSELQNQGLDNTIFLLPKVRCLFMLERYEEGIKVAISGLSKVKEVEISMDPTENRQIASKLSSKIPLSVLDIRNLSAKEHTTNPRILLIYELISEIIAPSYFLEEDDLRYSLSAQTILLMHEYGVSPYCALPLIEYSNYFIRKTDESSYFKAIEFGKLALNLVDSDTKASFTYVQKVYEEYITGIASLMEPVSDVLKYFDVYISGPRPFIKTISSTFDGFKVGSKLNLMYLTGHSVGDIVKYGSKNTIKSDKLRKQDANLVQLEGYRLLREEITFEQFDRTFDLSKGCTREFTYCYNAVKLFSLLMSSKFEEAGSVLYNSIGNLLDCVPFMLLHFQFYFYSAMVLRARPSTIPKVFRDTMWNRIYSYFSIWSSNCPVNFKGKFLMIHAMKREEDSNAPVLEILDLYEEAIEHSKSYDMWHDVAWGNKLCGIWLINDCNNPKRGKQFINTAFTLFSKYEDNAIATRMKISYSKYLQDFNWAGVNSTNHRGQLIHTSSTTRIGTANGATMTGKSGKLATINIRNNDILNSPNGAAVSKTSTSKRFTDILSLGGGLRSRKSYMADRDQNLWSQIANFSDNSSGNSNSKVQTPVQSQFTFSDSSPATARATQENSSQLNRAVTACLSISESLNDDEIVQKLLESTILFSTADYGVVVSNLDDEPYIQAIGTSKSIFQINNEPLSSRTDLCPVTLVKHVLQSGEIISKDQDYLQFVSRYDRDDYYYNNPVCSVICIPLKNRDSTFGALYLEIQNASGTYNSHDDSLIESKSPFLDTNKRDLLDLLCAQAAVSLEKARLYTQMEYAKMAAEDATAEKASFLANMSHEIRTPFNSLLSCSIFLLDTTLSLTQREYVETIKSSAMVTLNIIDGILAFSKIEHGSFTLDNAKFSLNECIESALHLVGEQAATNNLELVFFNKCPNIDCIMGDVTRFRQIVINLVGNSVKFTSKGHILVETKAVELTKDRYEIVVSVADTGIGIPKESHNKVFGAFSQVDGSSQRMYGGSGLGLAISKKLAEIMGGSLTFESAEGAGSTFKFIVNAQVEKSKPAKMTISNLDTAGSPFEPKALIIDSNKLGSIALKESLNYFGLDVDIRDSPSKIPKDGDYLLIFVHADKFESFKQLNDLKCLKNKIVVLAQYGKPLPAELHTHFVNSMLLIPFRRSKICSLLKDVKSKLKSNITSLNVPTTENDSKSLVSSNADSTSLAEKFPLKILLAEDNFINIKVALQHLRKLGYEADHAKDGVEVLEMCNSMADQNMKYDVILLDIQMPRKDGFTAAIELQQQFISQGRESLLPAIVALTANVAGEDRERSLRCGMVDFIPKPILPNELKRVLLRVGKGEISASNSERYSSESPVSA